MRELDTRRCPVVEGVPADEETLALHTWDDGRPGLADLFYVHGLQSHAGWLFETGPALLKRGVRLTVLDRRGSGASTGPRGHLPDARTALADYGAALARLVATASRPVTVLGQSFGGGLVAAMVASGRVPHGSRIVLCAPALGQQRARFDEAARARVLSERGLDPSVVRIEDEQYTNLPGYLRLMANDGLMVRSVTKSFRAAMVETEDLYVAAGPGPWVDRHVWVAYPEQDSIIDLRASESLLAALAPQAVSRRFPVSSHYLEFTDAQEQYWDWVAAVVRGGGEP
ncbi:alpha/beta hydrolase [Streptomyces johnsoniae]|uniref:Alpha/beta fold hydrolase n=1 Tax=Streptomyces johnsoniae TaxID=3075532 RepID=A0ABU2S8V6_9ACTN|nr:alpha/beta fold hydrolase [Streptomyces sp. DSM 41886]MDT0445418.1 alpha/beta fold hydrolase [Streptomyces sp. DSM 41886]